MPEDIQIQSPPLWTPTATELAQIASTKTQTIMAAFQLNAITLGMALTELKKLEDETGMFGSIDDKWIKKNEDKTFNDLQQMADPMAGLFGGEEEPGDRFGEGDKPEGSKEDTPFQVNDAGFNPHQPRDPDGRWSSGSGGVILDDIDAKPTGIILDEDGNKTLDKAERKRYIKHLKGCKTSDGRVVKGIHTHGYQRIAERGISPRDISDCLETAQTLYPANRDHSTVYQTDKLRVVYDYADDCVHSVFWRE